MGKGFNNYMNKKFFHPGNLNNRKRVRMTEQKSEHEKKKEEEKMQLYLREQEMNAYRALLEDEKAKVGLSFMYDPHPGMTRAGSTSRSHTNDSPPVAKKRKSHDSSPPINSHKT